MRPNSLFKVRAGPSGIHLFNRDTGVNILVDEIVPPRELWAMAPRQVSIALTNACDLSCPFCYAPKHRAVLDFDRALDWITELDRFGCLGIGFGGGEPTIYPRLVQLCAQIAKSTNLAITMTTHGHRVTTKLVDELAGCVNFVRVSMDGVGATYETIRNRSFDDLLGRIGIIRQVFPFGVNFVVNEQTYRDLDAAIELAAEIGATEFLLLPEQPVGHSPGVDQATLGLLRSWVTQYRGEMRLSISESSSVGFPTCEPLAAEEGLSAFAHIDASGILRRSSFARSGTKILNGGVMAALQEIREEQGGL